MTNDHELMGVLGRTHGMASELRSALDRYARDADYLERTGQLSNRAERLRVDRVFDLLRRAQLLERELGALVAGVRLQ